MLLDGNFYFSRRPRGCSEWMAFGQLSAAVVFVLRRTADRSNG